MKRFFVKELPCGCRLSVNTLTRRFSGYLHQCPKSLELWGALFDAWDIYDGKPTHKDILAAQAAYNNHRRGKAGTP